ncbi:MAG: PD-(D/E)XK nuclease family protein, partial [Clostridia bacterium]|nr:PD-(D/E)XK nuclease family protein [Clostridia bacterium]
MLEIICGSANAKKTEYLINRTASALKKDPKAKFLFLVPEQDAVSAESRIFKSLPHYAPLSVEVDNFSRLADSVFRRVGGIARTQVGRNAKKICMWRTLKTLGMRSSYESVSSSLSLANELISSGATPAKLSSAASSLKNEKRLSELLSEYSLILSMFNAFISEIGFDSNRDGEKLCEALSKNSIFADTEIIIDGFTSFTGIEYEIIASLEKQAKKVTVTMADDPEGNGIWLAEIKECFARLKLIVEKDGRQCEIITLSDESSDGNELSHIKANLWNRGADKLDKNIDVRIVECSSPMDEAQFVANDIQRLVREGVRYGEIAVAVRDLDSWRGVIDVALAEHGIPAFISGGDKLIDHPAVRFILRAASAAGFNRDDVASMLKTGYLPISDDDCDTYIRYAKSWKITKKDFATDEDWTMSPDGYNVQIDRPMSRRARASLEAVNRVRRAVRDLLMPLSAACKEKCDAARAFGEVFALAGRAGLKERLEKESLAHSKEGNITESERCARVWNSMIEALDGAVSSLCDDTLALDDICTILKLLFSDTELSGIPSSKDSVTVGAADMLRANDARHIYILGACEGEFPAAIASAGFFSRREEDLLKKEGIAITKDGEMLASRELYLFRKTVGYATDSLTVLYHTNGLGGEKCIKSSAVSNLCKLYNNVNITDGSTLISSLEAVWDRRGAERLLDTAITPEERHAIGTVMEEKKHVPHTPDYKLSEEMCERLFEKNINLTQSRIESYAKCRFMYYCQYILGLQPEAVAEFTYASNGTFIHAMLERIIPIIQSEELNGAQLSEKIEELSNDYFCEIIPARDREDARLSQRFGRMKDAVRSIVSALVSELKSSKFVPIGEEIAISDTDESLPRPIELDIDGGKKLRIFGTVDRADILKTDGDDYVRVVDYKTNDKAFRLTDVENGVNLQLLIYLLTLCGEQNRGYAEKIGAKSGKLSPGGMLYCVTKPPEKLLDAPPSADEYESMINGAAEVRGLMLDGEEVIG